MSIINQALKQAQREQRLHDVQAAPYPAQLSRPRRQGWPWALITAGCLMTLGAGLLFRVWLVPSTPSSPVPRHVAVPYTPSTTNEHPIPPVQTMTSWVTDAPQPVVPRVPLQRVGFPHLPPVLTSSRRQVERPRPSLAASSSTTRYTSQPEVTPTQSNISEATVASLAVPIVPPPDQKRAMARAHFNRALEVQEIGDLDRALTLLQQALELDPALNSAYNSLGNLYYQGEQYQQALAMYKQALALNPDDIKAHNNLGSTYMQLARHDQAIAALRKALQVDNKSGLAYYNLACVYARMGESTTATHYLQQALELEPQARIWAQTDTDFTRVRTTPEFQQLLGPS